MEEHKVEGEHIFVLFAYYGPEANIKGAYSDLHRAIEVAENPGWDRELPDRGIAIFAVPLDSEFDVISESVDEAVASLLGKKELLNSHRAIRVYTRRYLATPRDGLNAGWNVVFDMRDSWQSKG